MNWIRAVNPGVWNHSRCVRCITEFFEICVTYKNEVSRLSRVFAAHVNGLRASPDYQIICAASEAITPGQSFSWYHSVMHNTRSRERNGDKQVHAISSKKRNLLQPPTNNKYQLLSSNVVYTRAVRTFWTMPRNCVDGSVLLGFLHRWKSFHHHHHQSHPGAWLRGHVCGCITDKHIRISNFSETTDDGDELSWFFLMRSWFYRHGGKSCLRPMSKPLTHEKSKNMPMVSG